MRGPGSAPSSIARLSENDGPPMSRTVVKPRISVAVASPAANSVVYPTSLPNSKAGVARIIMACQWASVSPGISTRPPPAMTRTFGSAAIGLVEMRSIRLPLTSTLDGEESVALFPLKTRTF